MPIMKMAALLVTGLALEGCDGALDGYPSASQEAYPAQGYYAGPPSPAPGYYGAPVYPGPGYYQQPVYVAPYEPGWGPGRDGWHDRDRYDRDRHEHGGYEHGGYERGAYGNDGRQPRQDYRQPPQMATQPRMAPPAPPPMAAPPSVPRAQADQNRHLMDQLGFRPSH